MAVEQHIRCSKCEQSKPRSEFYSDTSKKAGHHSQCVPCRRAYVLGYMAERREQYNKRAKDWYEKNKAHKSAYDKVWRVEYDKRTRERKLAYVNARRRRARRSQPSWANKFFVQEAYRLALLRSKLTGVLHEVDHIVPLTSALVCGLHWEGNLQVIPSRENKAKNNRWWPDKP
jgi:hypothetical protein